MKTFKKLSPKQQEAAIERELVNVLKATAEGLPFCEDTQRRLDRATEKANRNGTPQFWHEFVMEDEVLAKKLRDMAIITAKSALYYDQKTLIREEPVIEEKETGEC